MKYISLVIFLSAIVTSCNLSKEVDINLPEYMDQPVVECYLIPGQRYELLLTHSNSFFDPLTGTDPSAYLLSILESGAKVMILHGNDTIHLEEHLELNPISGFISNYSSPVIVPEDYSGEFNLLIQLSNGSFIKATTGIPYPVKLDSVRVEYANTQKLRAIIFAYHHDNRSTDDYYRRMIHVASLDSFPMQNFTLDDKINDTEEVAFGAFYERQDKHSVVGDTMIISLSHITKDYHLFFQSRSNANAANGNPFGQPGQIVSNVSGPTHPIGIFTGFVMTHDTIYFK